MTPTRRTLALALVLALLTAGCGGAAPRRPSGCVLADVSGSTHTARREYGAAFSAFATAIGTHGSGDLCLVVAAGDPIAESAPMFAPVGPTPEHRDSPDFAPGEIADHVGQATADFQSLMVHPPVTAGGSALVEAAVVAAGVLRPGDRLSILSDGIQSSPATGDFHTVDLSAAGIRRLLDRLQRAGLMARLPGVAVEMPLLLYHPGGLHMRAERQEAIRRFWSDWARRAGAHLVGSTPARAQRIS